MDLEDGLGGIVFISGERGMGKSLLMRELRQDISRQQALLEGISSLSQDGENAGTHSVPVRVHEIRGRGRSYDQTRPYAVWQDLLHQWLGVRDNESPEMTRDRLHSRCTAIWGEVHVESYIYLATLLGLPVEAEYRKIGNRYVIFRISDNKILKSYKYKSLK